MLDRAIRPEPQARDRDRPLTLDERSMRILELGLAGMAILAVVLLSVAR